MKLYFTPAACSLAPHIALAESGLPYTLEKVDGKAKKTETGADYWAINPRGYVPALQMDDGDILAEGVVIQQYIADLAPASKLAPAHGTKERLRLDEWLVYLSTEIHKTFGPLFTPTAPDETKTAAKDKLGQRFDYIEKAFGDGRQFLNGDTFTIADTYLFTLSNWTRFVGIDLARWPSLAAYVQRITTRPSVQRALKEEGLA